MRKLLPLTFIFIFVTINYVNGYRIFAMKESGSCLTHSLEITVGSLSWNSSGILVNAFNNIFVPGLNCTVFLSPPLSYGIVASIRSIDLQPSALNYEDCENYLEISPVEHHGSVRLCGYSDDKFEFQSYINWGGMRVSFHTSNSTRQRKAAFRLTFTAVRRENRYCLKGEQRCHNRNCIWKGLTCDGHNNCGDLSDEFDKYIAQCAAMSPGESLAVILVTIIGSLILLFIAAYLRGPKITQQIERLSQPTRLNNDSEAQSVPGSETRNTVSRVRTNYGSTNQLLPSYDYNEIIFQDPPPPYEEIQATLQIPVSVTSPQTHIPQATVPRISVNTSRIASQQISVSQSEHYIDSSPHVS